MNTSKHKQTLLMGCIDQIQRLPPSASVRLRAEREQVAEHGQLVAVRLDRLWPTKLPLETPSKQFSSYWGSKVKNYRGQTGGKVQRHSEQHGLNFFFFFKKVLRGGRSSTCQFISVFLGQRRPTNTDVIAYYHQITDWPSRSLNIVNEALANVN